MHGTYNLWLVALSLVIAVVAAYTVLDLTAFIVMLERRWLKRAWLTGGAIAMGTGIWSMHFVGMLAFSLPIYLGYDLTVTGASLIIAILVSYLALNLITDEKLTRFSLFAGGSVMGVGIAAMHYSGMAAMRMAPSIRYDAVLFFTSIAIAVAASTIALSVMHTLSAPQQQHAFVKRSGAAFVLGLAITGMHYTGMAAAHFPLGSVCGAANGISVQWLATIAGMFTLLILIVTLLVSRFDARNTFLRGMAGTLEELVKRRTVELEGAVRQYERTTHTLQRTRRKMEQEIEERKAAQARLEEEKDAQRRLIDKLEETHVQLLQSEKLASIGQLAAGVAHEINNPIGFVNANLNTLKTWVGSLLDIVAMQEPLVGTLPAEDVAPLRKAWEAADIDYVRDDILSLIDESIDGATRVRRIVQDLRDFSRPGSKEWCFVDLHAGLESTLNVVHNEIKYKAKVVREFGVLPLVECVPSQLNQVFMNMLVNAAQAISEHGTITIRTAYDANTVNIAFSDTGIGMTAEVAGKIFDPFFTTKPVGQGTGLGLSVSHGIIERHGGHIDVSSEIGQGTTFTVRLPVQRHVSPSAEPTANVSDTRDVAPVLATSIIDSPVV